MNRRFADLAWDAEQAAHRGDHEAAKRLYAEAAADLKARLDGVPVCKIVTHQVYRAKYAALLYKAGRYTAAIAAGYEAIRVAGPYADTETIITMAEEAYFRE